MFLICIVIFYGVVLYILAIAADSSRYPSQKVNIYFGIAFLVLVNHAFLPLFSRKSQFYTPVFSRNLQFYTLCFSRKSQFYTYLCDHNRTIINIYVIPIKFYMLHIIHGLTPNSFLISCTFNYPESLKQILIFLPLPHHNI